MEKNKTGSFFRRYRGELLSFLFPIALMVAYNLVRHRQMVVLTPDARLYLSVADNFLATGHFIETSRGGEWVVPFGLPLILTVFRALHMTDQGITVVQFALMGFTGLLLYKAEKNYFGRGGIAPVVCTLMMLWERINPWNIFVETYFLLILAWICWLLSKKDMPIAKRLLWLNVAGFAAFAIRTVLIIVYAPILVYTLLSLRRGQISGKRAAALFLVPALILGANMAVNHRETGHWIFSNNYAGKDIYVANNPYTHPMIFVNEMDSNVGREFYDIFNESTDFTEINEIFKERAAEWIRQNPVTFLKNAAIKYFRMFVTHWLGLLIPPAVFGIVWIRRKGDRLMLLAMVLGLLLTLVTCLGLAVTRYSAPLFPLVAMQYAAGWELLAELRARLRRGKAQ